MRGEIQALGMREAREKWRSIVTHVIDGQPILILRDLQPSAVMLRFDEVQRWRRIEESLSALHGLEIYPELATGQVALRGTAHTFGDLGRFLHGLQERTAFRDVYLMRQAERKTQAGGQEGLEFAVTFVYQGRGR